MPVVTMPNGDLVQFPDSMSREQIGQFIASKFPGVYDQPEPAIGDIFASALARGGINLEATLKDELPAYLASIIGQDEYAKEQLAQAEERRAAAAEQYPTQYGSFKDVESLGDVGGFIAEKFAENVPILGGLGISALTGAVAAPIVGATAATGATLAGALGSYSLMAPESFAGIYAETGKIEPAAASIAGAVNSALELIAPVQVVKSFSPSMRKAVVEAALKKSGMAPSIAANAAKGVVKGAATEGLTEGAQESVNIAAENFVSENPDIFTEENVSRVLESAVAGAAVGVPLGGIGGTGRGFRERSQFAQERLAQEQEEADKLAAETAIEEPVVAEKAAPEVPPTAIPTDKAALNTWGMSMLGIAPNAKILRPDGPLAGKDLSDPAQAAEVKTALEEYLKTAKKPEIVSKVTAVIRDLEPTGTFAAEPTAAPAAPVLEEDIPEPVVVRKETPTVAPEAAIDEELATRGFQKAEVQDEAVAEEDIPVDRPLWSKDLLGFLTDEYEFTEAELAQVQNFSEPEMRDFLAEVEARDNLVFEGPLVEEEMIVPQEPAAPVAEGVGQVKDPEQAKVVFDELGVNEEQSFNLPDEEFDNLVRTAQAQRAEKAARPTEEVVAPVVAPVVEPAAPVAPVAKKAAPATKKKPPAVKKFAEDKLAFRNKPLADKVYQELGALKAATSPQEEATEGRQILANYLHAYSTPEGAIAAVAAESNVDYTEIENKKLAATVADAQKAGAYINKNMDESVRKAFKENVDMITKELASIERRNAKEKADAKARKVSELGRSKTEKELSKAVNKDALKVDRKLKREKKKLVGETPEQIAKRIDKERRDAEAESLAELALDAEQEGTVGYVAAVIKNAQGIAEKTEAELGPQSRSNEWVKFIASLPKAKQKTFLDSYTRISKENPNLIPESVRARVVAENKKILSQKDQKRLVKFEEKFLLKTPKYKGPNLSDVAVKQVNEGDLQGAIRSVITQRDKRGDDKNITAIIRRINSKIVGTSLILDGPEVQTASGAYVTGRNAVILNTSSGLNEHTLLHEAGHAGLAQILNNREHPTTKKFIEFFDEIKTRVGDAYGGSDIQEFAAEVVSNGEFQALLKQIKPPNGDSLWTRIIQTIAEFFGLRKNDTAYDTTLKFLNDLLDVSQGIEPTLADTLYLGNGNVNQVLNGVSDNILARNADVALDKFSRIKDDKARVWALGTASLSNQQNMFGETSPRYKNKNPLPIGRLLRAIEKKRGEVNTEIDKTSKNIRSMTKAEQEATPAQREAFNDLAIDGRLLGIDIFKPAPKGAKAKADYQKLMNRYKNLPKGLQETYKTLRQELDRYLKEYVELINEVLPSTAASNLLKDFATLEGVAAYVPFGRDGEYWFRYRDPENLDAEGNPKETAMAAESPRKREMAVAALKAKHGSNFEVEVYDNISSMRVPKGLPEGQFVTKLVGELRNNNVDEKVVEQIYQQYVSMFPENSIIQQFKKSKNLPGMDRDVVTGYSNVAIKWANKIANTRYNPEIETAVSEIGRVAKTYHGGDKNITAAAKGIQMQEDFFLNPRVSPLASSLTFASYFEYILGSVSSAVVNLTGLVFMVTPMLGARTSYPKALSALQAAGVTATQDWAKIAKYKNMHDELDSRGLLKHTLAREALERGKTKGKDFNGLFYRSVDFLSTPFAASERYMRAATAIAAYDLALANGIPADGIPANNEKAAIDFAAKMVRDAHTGGMAETMPRWMQNDFGRVIWTFKNIVFQQAYVLGTAMKQAFIDSDLPPEVKRAAIRQVMGTYGLSFALLGVKGLPFFGATTTLMRMVEMLIPDDDEEPYDPRVQLSNTFDDFFYQGMIGSLLNVDVSSRAALANDILWRDDPKSIEDYGYVRTMLFNLAGPMGAYSLGVERAITEDFPAGRYERGFEGVAPTFVRNGLKSWRYMQEGARNRDGDPIDTDINAWNLLVQGIGFTPADLSNTFEQRSAAKNFENKVLARKQRILDKYKAAKKTGNKELQSEAVREANAFRRQFPTLMDENTLERSWKASVRVDREDTMAGITFTKGLRYMTDEFFE